MEIVLHAITFVWLCLFHHLLLVNMLKDPSLMNRLVVNAVSEERHALDAMAPGQGLG